MNFLQRRETCDFFAELEKSPQSTDVRPHLDG